MPRAALSVKEKLFMTSAFSFLPSWPFPLNGIFWAGLALLVAGLCGELCYRAWRLPRVAGYAVIGLVAGSAGVGAIDASMGGTSRLLLDVALGLLLFELGGVPPNPWVIASGVAEATLTFVLVLVVLLFAKVAPPVATVLAAISMA